MLRTALALAAILAADVAQAASELIWVTSPAAAKDAARACTGSCRVILAPGQYGVVDLRGLHLAPGAVELDFAGSTFTQVYVPDVWNLTINGGEVVGGNEWGQCWTVDYGQDVILENVSASRCKQAGFIITRSQRVQLLNWTMTVPYCDGVTVSGTDGFVVSGGRYSGYYPAAGDGCHADGVQMWGMDGFPLRHGLINHNIVVSTDVLLSDGKSRGSQGITAFGNNGPNGSAYEQSDITVVDNEVYTHGSWCVVISQTKNAVVHDNQCINVRPQSWQGKYGFKGSTGQLGPNWLDNQQVWGDANSPTPPSALGGGHGRDRP